MKEDIKYKVDFALYYALTIITIMCMSEYGKYFFKNINLYSTCLLVVMMFAFYKSLLGLCQKYLSFELNKALKEFDEKLEERLQEEQNNAGQA